MFVTMVTVLAAHTVIISLGSLTIRREIISVVINDIPFEITDCESSPCACRRVWFLHGSTRVS